MSKAQPGWELYRSFLAVVRERSLSGAARALDLTQPTVGRHVDALEQALGVTLFTRSQAGLAATEGATALVPFAEAMSNAADALQRAASGEAAEDRGAVRITASEMIGTEVLPQILATFREAHPRVVVELVISNRSEDLLRREADIAVRMVRPTQDALLARKVGTIHLDLHAHARYLKAHGTPKTMAELQGHSLIGFDKSASVRQLDKLGFTLTRDLFSFRCDSDVGQYAALRAGFGIGVCQVQLGKREKLVRIMPGALDFKLETWVAMHAALKSTKRMSLMFDHLVRHMRAYVLEGASA
ncbi:MAG: LysR family transcriptional regulator [Polyangiaceae bacterium]